MKYIAIAASVISVVFLSSCGQNEGGGARIEAARPNLPVLTSPPAAGSPSPTPASGTMPVAPIIASNKLNPAHGQPGHRCDIAVGAALPATGSPTGLQLPTANAPVINTPVQTAATTTPTVQPVATKTAATGMNPEHGQPGHRCDIPVGQPLNSKPAGNKPAATPPTPVVTTPTAPVKSDGNLAKGLNPAHGQPGHRCDIAVGQPLTNAAKKDSLTN